MEDKKKHSVKVPRLYKVAAKILRDNMTGKGSIKTLVYDSEHHKHPNVNALIALVTESVKHRKRIKGLFSKIQLFEKEPRFDPNLAAILTTELLWGKGVLKGESLPIITINKYADELRRNDLEDKDGDDKLFRPRYVRINAIKNKLSRVTKHLKAEGFLETIYENISYDRFLDLVKNLKLEEFLLDYHVKNLLVFAPKTNFFEHPLLLDGSLALQDKASCLPVDALELPVGGIVLDACAAPGMKTTQIAAAVSGGWTRMSEGQGYVYAFDRDPKRCLTLRKMVTQAGADAVTDIRELDFLSLDPNDYQDVKYIVLDPSCSGSGMNLGMTDISEDRLEKLMNLQVKMLLHAMSFPNVLKISYSTCSIYPEENEMVIEKALKRNRNFKSIRILDSWTRRGLPEYKHSSRYIRADPKEDLCLGFFVAVLQQFRKKRKINETE